MIELIWFEEVRDPHGRETVSARRTRWFDDRAAAERWAADALLPGEWRVEERPGQLNWRQVADAVWVANHRQVAYGILREVKGWCGVINNYELLYEVQVDGDPVFDGRRPRLFRDLQAAMAWCEERAFGSRGEAK